MCRSIDPRDQDTEALDQFVDLALASRAFFQLTSNAPAIS